MKKIISILTTVVIIMGVLTACGESTVNKYATPIPTENPLKSNYYTDLDGEQAYVVVGKLSHITISCDGAFVPWQGRDTYVNRDIYAYLVTITPIEGENFTIDFDKSEIEQVIKFTTNEGYFRVYLTAPEGAFLKGPEWINQNSNTSSTDTSSKSNNYSSIHQKLLGSWVQPNANLIWIYKEDEFIIDYSEAFPGDYSAEAEKVRALPPSHVSYTIDGEYLIFTMGQANYRNKIKIVGDTLEITNSIDGKVQTYYRKK